MQAGGNTTDCAGGSCCRSNQLRLDVAGRLTTTDLETSPHHRHFTSQEVVQMSPPAVGGFFFGGSSLGDSTFGGDGDRRAPLASPSCKGEGERDSGMHPRLCNSELLLPRLPQYGDCGPLPQVHHHAAPKTAWLRCVGGFVPLPSR